MKRPSSRRPFLLVMMMPPMVIMAAAVVLIAKRVELITAFSTTAGMRESSRILSYRSYSFHAMAI
jgi:hypothetical protein